MTATCDRGKGGGAPADEDGGAARGALAWYMAVLGADGIRVRMNRLVRHGSSVTWAWATVGAALAGAVGQWQLPRGTLGLARAREERSDGAEGATGGSEVLRGARRSSVATRVRSREWRKPVRCGGAEQGREGWHCGPCAHAHARGGEPATNEMRRDNNTAARRSGGEAEPHVGLGVPTRTVVGQWHRRSWPWECAHRKVRGHGVGRGSTTCWRQEVT